MGDAGSPEQIICQTTRCKIPEATLFYSNTTPRHFSKQSELLTK